MLKHIVTGGAVFISEMSLLYYYFSKCSYYANEALAGDNMLIPTKQKTATHKPLQYKCEVS